MSHTPGPWIQSKNDPLFIYALYELRGNDANRFELLVQNGNYGTPREELEANARLIAAAPELLEACKAALAAQGSASWNYQVEERLKAAIAKVEVQP